MCVYVCVCVCAVAAERYDPEVDQDDGIRVSEWLRGNKC